MTLYLKYRPQKINELDINEVRDRLGKILASAYTPHAFLFSGPKGTGKTSAARIVAKVLNCESAIEQKKKIIKSRVDIAEPIDKTSSVGVIVEPCDKCESCIAIREGRHLDILENDAASNRGIDEIRDLREKIRLSPVTAKYKVYIIDEVHMLTTEAFNALLKTLEEPPPHAVFVLATTEPEKLPGTIISRCINFTFHKASNEEVVRSLKRVANGEKLDIAPEILEAIALSSEGSFRDATKFLEQAILENLLTADKIKKVLGRDGIKSNNLLKEIAVKNTKVALQEITDLEQKGADMRLLVAEMLQALHKVLLAQHGLNENFVDRELVNTLSKSQVNDLIKLLSKVYIELRNSSIAELPLEVAVVEWCEGK